MQTLKINENRDITNPNSAVNMRVTNNLECFLM